MDIKELFGNMPYINVTGFAKEIDINPSLMRRYACGQSTPSEIQKKRIIKGLSEISDKINKCIQ